MWHFLKPLRRVLAGRSAPRREPASFRPALEELERRRLLSTAGVISAVDYSDGGPLRLAVFSLAADRSLWEYTTGYQQTPQWSQVSPAAFDSISASRNADNQPVVFGVLASDHSLWENNPAFNPAATCQNDQWLQVSPGAFDSISAIFATVNGGREPVVYGIVSSDHSLWENNSAFNPSAQTLNDQWLQVSPGAFTAVSATVRQDFNGPSHLRLLVPVAYALVQGDHSLWLNDPTTNAGAADLNADWQHVSTDAFTSISASTESRPDDLGNHNQTPIVFAIRASDQSLWEYLAPNFNESFKLSSDVWAAVDKNYAIRASDLSLWKMLSGGGLLSPGSFEAVSSPEGDFPGGTFEYVFAVPTNHSLWENDVLYPNAMDPTADWTMLSPSNTIA